MSDPSGRPVPAFRPARFLGNAHVQTIAGKVLRPEVELPLRRERLATPDGDFLDLDFAGGAEAWESGGPVAVVLHGLEGRATRRYMRTTYAALLERGVRPVGLNFRGCSGEPNRTARTYHSGETGDLRLVLDRLRSRFDEPFGLVGYSLGGNVVLKYLGESGSAAVRDGVVAGAAVSVPFDLAAGARALESGLMGRLVYTRYFMRGLRSKLQARADLVGDVCDMDAIRRARTIREFDDAATAPIFGFENATDYYARSSSAGFVAGIRVPALVVHSRDDPFLPARWIPEAAMAENPAVTPVITERGGHQGYVAGSLLRPEFWVEEVVADWLSDRLRARE